MELDYQLNPEQQKVVTTTEGPVLVLAGAGSGKTRCVIFRALYLIQTKNVRPWNVLIVTFTNKAANELKYRLAECISIPESQLWIGTFHSICTRILRYENESLPFNSNFTIYDASDQVSVLKKIYKELNIDKKKFALNKVHHIIGKCKNSLIRVDDFFAFYETSLYTQTVEKIYRKYQEVLLQNNALDFDDLLLYTAFLLEENKTICQKYADQFQYIMIDEYQDTNYAQFKIIHSLAKEHQNICVVGDDDQAIYSWRGATIKNILHFEKDYQNVTTIKLEHNYRSQQAILDLANSLIEKNTQRHPKELWSTIKAKEIPLLKQLHNEKEEAQYVAKQIFTLRQQKQVHYNQIAILYRTNAQSRSFEILFQKQHIPYQIIGGVHFYQRKEIKDILAYLRLLVNPADNESFLRIINFPTRGIGNVTINKINKFAMQENLTLFATAKQAKKILPKSAFSKVDAFLKLYEKWTKYVDISILVERILEDSKILSLYENSDDPQDIARVENISEFSAAVQEFVAEYEQQFDKEPQLSDFLQNLSLQTDLDNFKERDNSVKLMTMHNAKGLEFEYVFVAGMTDDLLPHSLTHEDENAVQEERRLLYVAITRAKFGLFLTLTKMRSVFFETKYCFPSRFITEFHSEKFQHDRAITYSQPITFPKKQKTPDYDKQYFIGQKIMHDKFGKGIILNVEGNDKNAKLTISFGNGMLKKIMGNYVKTVK